MALARSGLPVGARVAGSGSTPADLARLTGLGAAGANAVNNLPAYLALEAVAQDTPERLMALLIGVNVAPLVTPGPRSRRCCGPSAAAAGIRISPASLAWQGLVCALVATGLAFAGLVLSA